MEKTTESQELLINFLKWLKDDREQSLVLCVPVVVLGIYVPTNKKRGELVDEYFKWKAENND